MKSIWSTVRKSLIYLDCSIDFIDTTVHLAFNDKTTIATNRFATRKLLKEATASKHLNNLLEAPDQGRSFHLISKDPNSNHWLADAKYLSFSDYRFALKARLNLLPTKMVLKRTGHNLPGTTCPKCHCADETLAHVLNACVPNSTLMRARHNQTLQRLVKAIPEDLGEVFVEQTVKDAPDDSRPDIVVTNETTHTTTIVDVTIPIETSPLSFENARAEKLRKYNPLLTWFRQKQRLRDHSPRFRGRRPWVLGPRK